MCVVVGDKYSTCPTCFGSAGSGSTCPNFKSGRTGRVPEETLFWEISWSTWMTLLLAIRGSQEGSCRQFLTREDLCVKFGSRLRATIWTDPSLKCVSFKRQRNHEELLQLFTHLEIWTVDIGLDIYICNERGLTPIPDYS